MVKVSVLILTYNHEAFIAEALNSVLMQEVNFEFEIVIGEDFSTDYTRNILQTYKQQYPEKVKILLHEANIGMHSNFEKVFDACFGEYIALLEGDDYWISKDKLQKQVDFMDMHSNFSECFHLIKKVNEDNREAVVFPSFLQKNVFELEDVVSEFFIPTPSILFRKSVISSFPLLFYQMKNPDWMIHVLCAEKGKVGVINEVMGVYRVHSGGVWSGISRVKVLENTIFSAKLINKYLNFQYDLLLKRRMLGWHLEARVILMRNLKYVQAYKHFFNVMYLRVFLILRKLMIRIKNS